MTTVTIKGFVHKNKYGAGYEVSQYDMSEFGDLLVGPVEFQYEVPAEFNPVVAAVRALEKKRDALNKEHTDKVRVINESIAKLLCIENKPSQNSEVVSDGIPF